MCFVQLYVWLYLLIGVMSYPYSENLLIPTECMSTIDAVLILRIVNLLADNPAHKTKSGKSGAVLM
jgi:hypothetical protein